MSWVTYYLCLDFTLVVKKVHQYLLSIINYTFIKRNEILYGFKEGTNWGPAMPWHDYFIKIYHKKFIQKLYHGLQLTFDWVAC